MLKTGNPSKIFITIASIQQHIEFVRHANLCLNCLQGGHFIRQCRSGTCHTCSEKQHTLLHTDTYSDQALHCKGNRENQLQKQNQGHISPDSMRGSNTEQESSTFSYCSHKIKPQMQILLTTPLVKMRDKYGQLQICRALLGSSSQSHFITEECVQCLGLKKERNATPTQGINDATA
ncbi:hypothetical protein PR048_002309 [Dryococelus australis]|uniref:CCHC-type domain-containing protein n=1 Tax=Dryococelus australis TaxID=614101 RepID=A0ABQ9IMB6_9NEOP|nr:hypothetical protein PR048_002309 [Dryococelus australis]